MGKRTKEINIITEKKNNIVKAYYRLNKNNSSYFDNLIISYGKEKLCTIISNFGLSDYNINQGFDKNIISQKVAYELVKNLYGKNYIPMELYSASYIKDKNRYKQQNYICFANKNKIDRKHKFEYRELLKIIENKDIVLVDIKERDISFEKTELLEQIENNEYMNQVCSLMLKMMPTISTICKKQNHLLMQEVKLNEPKIYREIIELDKSIAKDLFLYETTKEQLLLNDALEEFQSSIWGLPYDDIKENINEIQKLKSKADVIGGKMQKNELILRHIDTNYHLKNNKIDFERNI